MESGYTIWIVAGLALGAYELVQFSRGGATLTSFLNAYVLPHRPGIYLVGGFLAWAIYHLLFSLGTLELVVDLSVAGTGAFLLGELGFRVRRWLSYRKERQAIDRLFREVQAHRRERSDG